MSHSVYQNCNIFLNFYISQGSVTTYVSDEKHDNGFIAITLLN